MVRDESEGWDAIADRFVAARSGVGAALVRDWAERHLPPGSTVLDVGCGSGEPIARALIDAGHGVFGVDASPALVAAFEHRFPGVAVACEAAQTSDFFGRCFDGAVAVGLLFLLAADDQQRVIARIAEHLHPGGRFLFSAPRERCEWQDVLTGRASRSLGADGYARILDAAALRLAGTALDEGGNHYFDAVKDTV